MKLGDKLKKLQELEHNAISAREREKEEASGILRAKKRAERKDLMEAIKTEITVDLNRGRFPCYKLYNNDIRSWVNFCRIYSSQDDQDLWDGLIDWAKKQGMKITIACGWDRINGNFRDWLELTVEPIQEN